VNFWLTWLLQVTIAMALIGAMGWINAALLIISQILGAIAAAGVVSALFPGPLSVRTTLSPETSAVRGLFIEMFLTAQLIFCIFMLAAEKHRSTFIAPIGIGLALFIAELAGRRIGQRVLYKLTAAGVYFTGGSLNPARSFGPDVVLAHFDIHHWIYWIGPLLGAILAAIFYRLIKGLEYESAIPNADSDGHHDVHHNSGSYDRDDDGVPSRSNGFLCVGDHTDT
jgi:aquaporin related protein